MISLGAGAALAGLVSAVPQLVWLSKHKALVFGIAAALLAIAGVAIWQARRLPCPADPKLAHACIRLRRLSAVLYVIALLAFSLGFIFAFALPWLAHAFA
jgi:predicted small integral membrane protein